MLLTASWLRARCLGALKAARSVMPCRSRQACNAQGCPEELLLLLLLLPLPLLLLGCSAPAGLPLSLTLSGCKQLWRLGALLGQLLLLLLLTLLLMTALRWAFKQGWALDTSCEVLVLSGPSLCIRAGWLCKG